MKFSLNLLNRFVNIKSIPTKKLVDRLVFSGFEVEEVYTLAEATSLVIGKVIECKNHPNSDHLHLLKVDCGKKYGVLDIVCGAPNARENINVIVARVGANLPRINLTIKESVIRGEKSCGMCCSLVELGVDKSLLSENQINGIEEVDPSIKVGEENVLKALNLNDTIIDINILPNRSDCLSYFGLAREIASLFNIKELNIPATKKFTNKSGQELVKVKTKLCPRFDIVKVSDLKIKDTPKYIKDALLVSGIRPISPLVDLGNYAMLLTGQPFNIYDADHIKSNFVIKDDLDTELITFDGKKVKVKKGDIVICDKNNPVCIAGIMALKNAAVSSSTTNIYIEAAIFNSQAIRLTSNRLGLVSYSSNLFSKGRNTLLVDEALTTILLLLDEFTTKHKFVSYSSNYSDQLKNLNPVFDFNINDLNSRLGSHYTKDEVDFVLNAYNIKKVGSNKLQGPIYRTDLAEQCDIDEEVFRYYSTDKLDINFDSYPKEFIHKDNSPYNNEKNISNYLVNNGFYRILSYTLIDKFKDEQVRVFSNDSSYVVRNAMTSDHEIVRSDLIPSMLETIHYNLDHFHNDFKLFEISPLDLKFGTRTFISFGLVGKRYVSSKSSGENYSFFDLKGYVSGLFTLLGIRNERIHYSYSKNKAFHPKASADINIDNTFVGTIGLLHPNVEQNKVVVGELDLTTIFNLAPNKNKFNTFTSISNIKRELSFEVNDKVNYEELVHEIKKQNINKLVNIELFDLYSNQETNKKYITLSLTFSSNDEHVALKNEDIDLYINSIIKAVFDKFGVNLRN